MFKSGARQEWSSSGVELVWSGARQEWSASGVELVCWSGARQEWTSSGVELVWSSSVADQRRRLYEPRFSIQGSSQHGSDAALLTLPFATVSTLIQLACPQVCSPSLWSRSALPLRVVEESALPFIVVETCIYVTPLHCG